MTQTIEIYKSQSDRINELWDQPFHAERCPFLHCERTFDNEDWINYILPNIKLDSNTKGQKMSATKEKKRYSGKKEQKRIGFKEQYSASDVIPFEPKKKKKDTSVKIPRHPIRARRAKPRCEVDTSCWDGALFQLGDVTVSQWAIDGIHRAGHNLELVFDMLKKHVTQTNNCNTETLNEANRECIENKGKGVYMSVYSYFRHEPHTFSVYTVHRRNGEVRTHVGVSQYNGKERNHHVDGEKFRKATQ